MATAIKVENLSKIYRLGEIGTGTISRDIERFVKTKILKQEDPFLRIGETNDRAIKGVSDIVYSLKDINFEIEQGDAVGLLGRNGAGKSTLLKILSRVTSPTTGKINIKGRVASLLEVGTGFHPELTGRENIYLNGAILGMRKREIDRKLDEIIDFSGVERYIDTPVKRYSSGMYVRLAFAVAAHLESEILIVDEVLAVGDAEFQKKCLGKMGEVSKGDGRTVLFVSHDMQAIQKLCTQAILINNGSLRGTGDAHLVIDRYLKKETRNVLVKIIDPSSYTELQLTNGYAQQVQFEDLDGKKMEVIPVGKYWQVRIRFTMVTSKENFVVGLGIVTTNDIPVYTVWSKAAAIQPGTYEALFINDQILFATGHYRLAIGLSEYERSFHFIEGVLLFEILDIKDDNLMSDMRILKTSGNGLVINPMAIEFKHI
jgi:lipopolysaccharide transport system ATP-binding protein